MRELLLATCPVLLWVIVAIHVVFMVVLFTGYKKSKNMLYLLSGLITFGLFYDALILALGGVMTDGALLEGLSRVRFVSHGALIPLIFAICAYALNLKNVALKVVWAFTGILVVLGIAEGFAVELVLKDAANIIRYASGDGTPAWAEAVSGVLSYGTVIPLMIVGIIVWVKQKTPTLFLSGFLMFLFSALGPATGNFDIIFYISMYGEVLMVLFFYLYAKFNELHK
ncbi:MAG: hypothetical protein IJ455_01695 [Agathobacter sp.]|nr:hypothetical protein [Agathobacter sp.]